MTAADIGWVIITGLAIMFIAQYGRQIRKEREDQPTKAGMARVFVRSTDTITTVVWYLTRGAKHTLSYIQSLLLVTFSYLRRMGWWAVGAFGIAGGVILYTLVGIIQFDPVAWLYVAIGIFSSLEVFDMGIISDPAIAGAILAGMFLVIFIIKWMIAEGMND